ncbi:MAG: hypothetical protein U0587_05270 [Candidatus Binatia bacterium]
MAATNDQERSHGRRAAPRRIAVELQCLPEHQPQPHIAEPPLALHTQPVQANRNGLGLTTLHVFKERPLLIDADTADALGQRLCLAPATRIELAQVGDRFLLHLPVAAHRAHQTKVPVGLSALAHYQWPNVQRPTSTTRRLYEQRRDQHKRRKFALHAIFAVRAHRAPAISRGFSRTRSPKNIFSRQTAEVGLLQETERRRRNRHRRPQDATHPARP